MAITIASRSANRLHFVRHGAHGGNALDILACERFLDQPANGVWASDHVGLVIELAIAADV
jgi:hypothetical protein